MRRRINYLSMVGKMTVKIKMRKKKKKKMKRKRLEYVLRTRKIELVKQIVTPAKQIRMQKKVHVMNQGAVKKNILEYVIVGEKVIFSIQTKNQTISHSLVPHSLRNHSLVFHSLA